MAAGDDEDYIVSREVFRDETGVLTEAIVQRTSFAPVEEVLVVSQTRF